MRYGGEWGGGCVGVGRGLPLCGGAGAGAETMRQAPSLAGFLPLLFGDGSSAAVSDSPQATGEGTLAMNTQWRSAALRGEWEETDDNGPVVGG